MRDTVETPDESCLLFKASPSQGPSGHSVGNCRSGQTLKKPKYLSECDREECVCGEGDVYMCERVS